MKTIHALLVGISEYANIRSLNSAHKDAERIRNYLEDTADGQYLLEEHLLQNDDATKANIVSHFEQHLIGSNAKEGDVLLFYFSGHGGQEPAANYFRDSEYDQKLENLACYDANLATADGLLADKELRWLISRASSSQAHVLVIFDCCHAGDNTRGADDFQVRLTGSPKQARRFDQFIFSTKVTENQFHEKTLEEVIPQGKHISFAACQSHESAVESPAGGIFTNALIQLLENSWGDISYLELKNRVGIQIKGIKRNQSPQVYASKEEAKDLFRSFLGGAMKDKPVFGQVFYNNPGKYWELNMGGIYVLLLAKMWLLKRVVKKRNWQPCLPSVRQLQNCNFQMVLPDSNIPLSFQA